MTLPKAKGPSDFLGKPAYAMLGYGGSDFVPQRSKAFSMQMQELACRSEERQEPSVAARMYSPQLAPTRRPCVRSLLLEPDMEDLTSIWPKMTDLNELNCPDEEEHEERVLELETEGGESRDAFFSDSIFCSGSLSAFPMTQAV
mmetsp:Transcript_19029/g.25748  ORF Transcript_19029/g.25748 Transcript_19029/m.25748 type:complete len:144 (+) Transcript_19029:1157-1588(+)|eukprot:CAMPEP_0185567676 /NCGR_PEP_ID=MMETSP0434-20130131/866_1 /TAXON_ID=626734 ORGANISM="Favella taraikaensis, Strain Fe Narragansett Bay" /NCGR_SAMPLE_ID=MMETSP0434 /ASSEMBLY_ACC=CAM_ASM_000379 /LENGTH=143 /DNA_ID=CAMNT_0028181961 /DNA_START=1110 /DNA_END=1541 /DNA_ORIENTATION=-